ncbi:MAG: Cro/C1-type DNA-binding domain [Firmicutes bacterium]|nr:Cro/C1-type DNA-binding domain [Bacillota bacterium]
MNLNQVMTDKKISGYRLSKLSGVSQTSISEYRNGASQPTLPIAKKIADALGVTIDDLTDQQPTLPKTG